MAVMPVMSVKVQVVPMHTSLKTDSNNAKFHDRLKVKINEKHYNP